MRGNTTRRRKDCSGEPGSVFAAWAADAVCALPMSRRGGLPMLILSDAAVEARLWQRTLDVAGARSRLGSIARRVVAGVAPEGFWRLPGKVDGVAAGARWRTLRARAGFVMGM